MIPPATRSPTRRDGGATRRRLERAALELYTTIGFHAATTPAIADRAGVAEGTIYRHFTGKEQLLNAVYQGAQRWAADEARALLGARGLDTAERLGRLARRLVEAAAEDPPTVRMLLCWREERLLDEESRRAARDFREALRAIVADGPSDGPGELRAAIWLTLVGFAAERVSGGEWPAGDPRVALTLEAAWKAISGGSAGG
jgi:AcrR family transcriptional regulator